MKVEINDCLSDNSSLEVVCYWCWCETVGGNVVCISNLEGEVKGNCGGYD